MSTALETATPRPSFFLRLCTQNPFYAISAALMLAGLWISFGTQTEDWETWLLMGSLTSYTLLLAGTAVALVRYLKLWEDARTILLLVVLMFLATSVTFDHVLMTNPGRGRICYLLGLGIAILISEGMLRALPLRLAPPYRLPYYLILALFFLYPLFVRALLDKERPLQEPAMWALFGFSTAAGLAFLTLLPALYRGEAYVRAGAPLPWPLYPWSLYGMLALAVPGRALLMCWSLQFVQANDYDRLVFGPFFLVPFGFALALLLLELGRTQRHRASVRFALVAPIFLIGLAAVGHTPADPVYRVLRVMTISIGEYRAFDEVRRDPDPLYAEFLGHFSNRLGADPLFCTLVLAAGFYAFAALRRLPLATEGLCAALAATSLIARNTLGDGLLSPPEPGPLLAPAALQIALGAWRRNVWHHLFGAFCLCGAVALALPLPELAWVRLSAGRVFVHLMLLAMLLLGAVHANRHGIMIRRIAAGAVLLLALDQMTGMLPAASDSPAFPVVYSLTLGVLLAAYGHLLHDGVALIMATAILGYWVFKFGWTAYRAVRLYLKGLDYIVPALAFFAIAVLVSLAKAGVLTRWVERRRSRVPAWLWPTPPPQAPEEQP